MNVKIAEKIVPVHDTVDILVVGGGPAGIGAAVAAARLGQRVMLLEKRGFLGGNITASYVETCNHFMHRSAFQEMGVYKEIREQYTQIYGRSHDIREDVPAHRFSSEYLKVFLDAFMFNEGVDVKLHAFVNDVIRTGSKIDCVVIQTKQGPRAIRAKMVIDATGDGDVAFSAGVPFDQGKAGNGLCQPGTVNFRITGVDVAAIQALPGGLNGLSNQIMKDHIAGKTSMSCERQWIAFGRMTSGGQISYLNYADVYRIDPTDVDGITRGEVEGRKRAMEAFWYLKKNIKGMENIELASLAPEIGFRDSRRIKGRYTLTTGDIELSRQFDDVIAVYPRFYDMLALDGDWSKGRGYDTDCVYIPIEGDRSYQIPYRCLLPVVIDNLLVAGRCISSDHLAESSIRAITACMLTGQAAGSGAVLAIQGDTHPADVSISALQALLRQQDVTLP